MGHSTNCSVGSTGDRYRHFAVDEANDVVYLCDPSPFRPHTGSVCRTGRNRGILWTELPKYVRRIIGYSTTKGRMFLEDTSGRALISSSDGVRMEVGPISLDQVLADPSFLPAVAVPGFDKATLEDAPVKFSPDSAYQGEFDSLLLAEVEDQSVARWTSCCKP